jgi:hypothetical protein
MSSQATPTSEIAVQQYIETLDDDEKSQFSCTTIEDVLKNVRALEQQQATFSRTRRISRRIESVVGFLQRYAMAVDVMVQCSFPPSVIPWGMLAVYIGGT